MAASRSMKRGQKLFAALLGVACARALPSTKPLGGILEDEESQGPPPDRRAQSKAEPLDKRASASDEIPSLEDASDAGADASTGSEQAAKEPKLEADAGSDAPLAAAVKV